MRDEADAGRGGIDRDQPEPAFIAQRDARMARFRTARPLDACEVLEVRHLLQLRIGESPAQLECPSHQRGLAGSVQQHLAAHGSLRRAHLDGAVLQAADAAHRRRFAHRRARLAREVEQCLVEHGPFDVEDGLASDQGVVERELAGCGRVAETEFGAVLRDLGQCRETRVDAQFAQQWRGARQQRLTDVEARMRVLFQHTDAVAGAGQHEGGSSTCGPTAGDDDVVVLVHVS